MYKITCEDTFIWQEAELMSYLYNCMIHNKNIELDFNLEGPCAQATGLYRMLDKFCSETKFPANKITIKTGNLIESHDKYNVKKIAEYWYEIKLIKEWLTKNKLSSTLLSSKHFGNFVGRSTWARLWVASILYSRHREKTVQTFHSGLQTNYITSKENTVIDNIGLDDLNNYGCDNFDEVIEFLKNCPLILKNDYEARNSYIAPLSGNYPIQHPANLMILNHYNDFFIDIVSETRVEGNVFFASEKTWRPIISRRPFIVVGPANFLKNLRKIGFVTFNNFWDEGYDDYDSGNRIKHIIRLIDTIGAKPIGEVKKLVADMDSILEHNYNLFMNLTYTDLKKVFND